MSTIIENVKASLESELRADELDTLQVEFRMYVNKQATRLKEITKKDGSTFGANPGPERRKAIDAVDLDAIKAMDKEELDLSAELELLRSLGKRLRAHFESTKAIELVAAAPARYVAINEALGVEHKAQAALDAARKTTAAALQYLNSQRQHVAQYGAGLQFPAADDALLQMLMQVRGYSYLRTPQRVGWFSPTGDPRQLATIATALGVQVPAGSQAA